MQPFDFLTPTIQEQVDRVRPIAQSAADELRTWGERVITRLDAIHEAVQSEDFLETRIPIDLIATGTPQALIEPRPGEQYELAYVSVGDAPPTQVISQQNIAAATTGNPATVDVSNVNEALFIAYNTDGVLTAGTDVDLFLRTVPVNAPGTVLLAAQLPGSSSSNSLSGGNASRMYRVDTTGVDILLVYPRNNNATIPANFNVDMYPSDSFASLLVGGRPRAYLPMRATSTSPLIVRGGTRLDVQAPAGTPVFASLKRRVVKPRLHPHTSGLSTPPAEPGVTPPNPEPFRHTGTWH